jgi:hypothetical protein
MQGRKLEGHRPQALPQTQLEKGSSLLKSMDWGQGRPPGELGPGHPHRNFHSLA